MFCQNCLVKRLYIISVLKFDKIGFSLHYTFVRSKPNFKLSVTFNEDAVK